MIRRKDNVANFDDETKRGVRQSTYKKTYHCDYKRGSAKEFSAQNRMSSAVASFK